VHFPVSFRNIFIYGFTKASEKCIKSILNRTIYFFQLTPLQKTRRRKQKKKNNKKEGDIIEDDDEEEKEERRKKKLSIAAATYNNIISIYIR
jgi:hypothetical protein